MENSLYLNVSIEKGSDGYLFSIEKPENYKGKKLIIRALPIVEEGSFLDFYGSQVDFDLDKLVDIVNKNNARLEKGADCPLQFDHQPTTKAKAKGEIYGYVKKFYLSKDEKMVLTDIEVDEKRVEDFWSREPRVFSPGFDRLLNADHVAIVGNGSVPSASMKNAEIFYLSLGGQPLREEPKGETMAEPKDKKVEVVDQGEKKDEKGEGQINMASNADYASLAASLDQLKKQLVNVENENKKLKDNNLEMSVSTWLSSSIDKGRMTKSQSDHAKVIFEKLADDQEGLQALQSFMDENQVISFANPEEQSFLFSMGYDKSPEKEEELHEGEMEILTRFTSNYNIQGGK